MSKLIAVFGDKNTHGDGDLLASNNSGKVFINGLKVVYVGSDALPDLLCPDDPIHCNPLSTTGSSKVFCEGIAVHRQDDLRICLATTIVSNQSKVFAGG
jgi:uncharacterized Zn-binding protein involved in type VI secretion